jgi:tetratricopeptide (TPR) repeat protein
MTQIATCPDLETLRQLLLGLVPETDALDLERHVKECPACSAQIEQAQLEDELVRAVQIRSPVLEQMQHEPLELMDRLQQLWSELSIGTADTAAKYSLAQTLCATAEATPLYDFLDPPQTPDELGRFGRYLVRRVLGRGGMGVIFLAEDTRLPRRVALKVLLDARYTDPHYLARFEREADALARLQHPHIVRVYEAGQHRGRPYLALEYIEGGTLAERLAGREYSADESARLVESLALAVHYAHSLGVVHRDLKPGNILLSGPEGRPLISDFGLAKQSDAADLTLTGDVLGTPGFIAPELIRGDKSSGPTVDVYSLGAILYQLLAGRPPYQGDTVLATLDLARSADPTPLRSLRPSVPGDLETICLKCLQREPQKRYATAADLADDLARSLRGEPIRAKPAAWHERLVKWARRNPALAGLVLVSAVFLVTAVAGSTAYSIKLRGTLKQVEQERTRADAGYESAQQTLDRMIARLERRRVGEAPQLKELQRELLEDALAFYQGVIDERDDPNPKVQRDVAVAYRRAGGIEALLGRWDQATEHLRQAIALFASLPAAERDSAETQLLLAGCHNNLGIIANNNRRWDEAIGEHRAALSIFEQVARRKPDDPAILAGIAESELDLGAVYQLTDRLPEAEKHYDRAAEMRTRLVEQRPGDETYQAGLADIHINLALIYQSTSRLEQAAAHYEKIESLLRPLVLRQPAGGAPASATSAVGASERALALTAAYSNWSHLLHATGQTGAAMAKLGEAIDLVEAVLQLEPQHNVARTRALNAHGTRAQFLESQGKWSEAVADWDRVVELDRSPIAWLRQTLRAFALARAGEHARAGAAASELVDVPEARGEGQYNLACVFALCIAAARRDEGVPAADRDALCERYAHSAIELLKNLHSQGYFNDAARLETLRTDEDLQSLRTRDDFKALLPPDPAAKQTN